MRFGFETMGFERIGAIAHVDNTDSNGTLIKAGFTKEGTLRRRFYVNEKCEDCNMYSILRDEDYAR